MKKAILTLSLFFILALANVVPALAQDGGADQTQNFVAHHGGPHGGQGNGQGGNQGNGQGNSGGGNQGGGGGGGGQREFGGGDRVTRDGKGVVYPAPSCHYQPGFYCKK